MKDIVSTMFNKFPEYDPQRDIFESELDMLMIDNLISDSGIRVVNSIAAAGKVSIWKDGEDPFGKTIEMIRNEIHFTKIYYENFYNSKVIEKDKTVKSICNDVYMRIIRLRRLFCIVNPDFTETKSYNAKADKNYSNVKCYYIDADGERKRMVSKNLGEYGAEIESFVAKLFKMNNYKIISDAPLQSGLKPDLIVEKDGVQFLVEVKISSLKEFLKVIMTFELWDRYTNEYYKL